MPVTVHKEQQDGTSYELSITGSRLTLARKISGLIAAYPGEQHDRHLRAVLDGHPGTMLPPAEFPYNLPAQFAALTLRTVQIEVINADVGNYLYTFAAPDDPAIDLEPSDGTPPPTYELDYSVEEIETEFDALGNVLNATYTPPGPNQTQVSRITKVTTTESLQVFRYNRREVTPAGGNPATFHNKVNSNQFTFAGETHPPRTWLCRNIGISAVFGTFGQAYDVRYEFMRRNKKVVFPGATTATDIGWDTTYRYIDPQTEQPVTAGVTLGNGLFLATMKEAVDFSGLALWV